MNDRTAQQQLYMHFYDDMYRLCYRYVTEPHAAVSVVNDGFLKVFKNIHQYNETAGAFRPWLKRVMVNTAIDYLRKKKTDIKVVEMSGVYEPAQEETGLNLKWSQQDLLRCLNQLPAMTRMVVNLVAFEGYSHREIAQQLDISEGASRWHLSEARKRLKQALAIHR